MNSFSGRKEELEYLRSRVRELQDLVLRYDEAEPKNSNTSDISPARRFVIYFS